MLQQSQIKISKNDYIITDECPRRGELLQGIYHLQMMFIEVHEKIFSHTLIKLRKQEKKTAKTDEEIDAFRQPGKSKGKSSC